MSVPYTTITNGQVAIDAPVTTALMTALRDNPLSIAQRGTNAPKIWGVPYDYQEFTSNGTWTKPSNAETGDVVFVQVVAGGGGGAINNGAGGGGGGGGAFQRFEDIDDFGATEAVVVGAGAAGGGTGGDSTFGTALTPTFLRATGGTGGGGVSVGLGGYVVRGVSIFPGTEIFGHQRGGDGGGSGGVNGESSITGGGGGCGSGSGGGPSMMAGGGGFNNTVDSADDAGMFPGGGGRSQVGASGGDGVVRVWCIREEA